MTATDKLGIVERLIDPHYIADADHARTPDSVLNLIQHTLRPERTEAAALIEELVAGLTLAAPFVPDGLFEDIEALLAKARSPQ